MPASLPACGLNQETARKGIPPAIQSEGKTPWAASSSGGFPRPHPSDSRSKTEAVLSRRTLRDGRWARIESLVPGKKGDRGRTGSDNRLFVDAIPWLARRASPWRDPPPEPGNWRTAHRRFRRWTLAGVRESPFKASSASPDFEYVLVDATIRKAHADASGAKRGLKLTRSVAPKAVRPRESAPVRTRLVCRSGSRSRRANGETVPGREA